VVDGWVLENTLIEAVGSGETRQVCLRHLGVEQRATVTGAVVVPASQVLVEVTGDDECCQGGSQIRTLAAQA
jgi:hypothetical protein